MGAGGAVTIDHFCLGEALPRALDHLAHGRCLMCVRADIVGSREVRIGPEPFGQDEIGVDWLQHVLPRPDGLRAADFQRLA